MLDGKDEPHPFELLCVLSSESTSRYKDEPSSLKAFAYEQSGEIAFVQVCPWHECLNMFVVEIARYITDDVLDDSYYVDDNKIKYKLYSIQPTDAIDEKFAINVLREITVNNSCPDLSAWEDITKNCLEESDDNKEVVV